MTPPKKKEIRFSKESVLMLMQEVYNEIVEQRNTAIRIQNKMLVMMKDPEDMQTIGPVIKEQQKIINDCVEKKLTLAKLQSSIWEKSQHEKDDFTVKDLELSDEKIEELLKKDAAAKTDETYTIKKS